MNLSANPELPLVSVLIAVYNGQDFLAEALDSALAQDYRPLEVVVVDDGSSDGTPAVLAGYGQRIRVVRHPRNRGLGAARNTSLAAARGDLLAFLDADDLWLPGKLSAQVPALLAHPRAALCHTASVVFGAEEGDGPMVEAVRQRIQGDCFSALVQRNGITISTALVRRDALPPHGFYEDLHGTEDYALWMQMLTDRPALYLPQVTTRYRRHAGQITSDRGKRVQVYSALGRLRALEYARPTLDSALRQHLLDETLGELRNVAYSRYWHRDYALARLAFRLLRQNHRRVPLKHRLRAAVGAWLAGRGTAKR